MARDTGPFYVSKHRLKVLVWHIADLYDLVRPQHGFLARSRVKTELPIAFLLLTLIGPATFAQLASSPVNKATSGATAETVYSQNHEANELFLKGRELAKKGDPRIPGGALANAREAIKVYEQAVKKDPQFALAYVEMSRAWLSLGYSDPDGLPNDQIIPPAKAALQKALALDDNLPEAHLALAALYYNL